MEKLIPIISKLQGAFSATESEALQLPQIVAFGEQSCGKSSVLESLIGRPVFPRGEGIVTRCPIVLQLVQIQPNDTALLEQQKTLGVEEWCEFPDKRGENGSKIITNFNEIAQEIDQVVQERIGHKNGISQEELVVKIYSPTVITLTVVDLPGIVRIPLDGQTDDIVQQINDLLRKYIRNPNSIILAVTSAHNDLATSGSIALAHEVDPERNRTVAVITKLDLMDPTKDLSQVLTGKSINFKLGIIGVVNRSASDVIQNNVTIQQSIDKEETFLRRRYPQLAHQNGIPYLRTRLNRILLEHIRACISPLHSRLFKRKIEKEATLESLGCNDPKLKREELLEIIEKFSKNYREAVIGTTFKVERYQLTGGRRINAVFDENLVEYLNSIDPATDLSNSDIWTTTLNILGIPANIINVEAVYENLVSGEIKRLQEPGIRCTELVITEMHNIMDICMRLLEENMNHFPCLKAAITGQVMGMLEKQHLVAKGILETYVRVQSSYIATVNPDFNSSMKATLCFSNLTKAELEESKDNLFKIVRQLVADYFQIVKVAFQDYCSKILCDAVVFNVVENIHRTLLDNLLVPEKMEQLMRESPDVAERREQLTQELKIVEGAMEAICEVRDKHL